MTMTDVRVISDIGGTSLTNDDITLLKHPLMTGVILFTHNYESRQQLAALTASIHAINPDLMITIDQEGGRVQRLREGFTTLEAMREFGKTYLENPVLAKQQLQQQLTIMIQELKAVGVDATLIPVVDLDYGKSEVTGCRSFGRDPAIVTELATIVIETLHVHGMPATLKHFPGHGFVTADSHKTLPMDSRDLDTLLSDDLVPYAHLLSKVEYVMPALITFPRVDHRPAAFSPLWLSNILRQRLGFSGKIITDDLSMAGAAAMGSYADRAEAAMAAGCDILLVCNNRAGTLEIIEHMEVCL